ncbi:MAG: hypothetical protein ACE5R6_08745 [Candidatus Heimdallarchaeota archaeon]
MGWAGGSAAGALQQRLRRRKRKKIKSRCPYLFFRAIVIILAIVFYFHAPVSFLSEEPPLGDMLQTEADNGSNLIERSKDVGRQGSFGIFVDLKVVSDP